MRPYLVFLLLLCFSCIKTEDPIGNFRVYLRLDLYLNDRDQILRTPGTSQTYTSKDINPNIQRVGFGGVLVVHAADDRFYAFDLACPYEASRSVRVAPDANTIYAVCPKCGTKYDIAFGTGAPNGVSRFYLKRYNVNENGLQLTISN
ncbi:MAG: (2Fe-2S)-binding protein [Tannerella sp.]|jgi:nitrite reductase/ring-hydroxylating ferredoxin subunit|nr:(2Fe-2S)-binding protein [Tannerella sp.]